jgi:hypothetical protein
VSVENGGPVARAELTAHIKGIDEHFDQLEDDVKAIRFDLHELHTELQTGFRLMQERAWLGPQGHKFMAGGSLLMALAAVLIAVLHG